MLTFVPRVGGVLDTLPECLALAIRPEECLIYARVAVELVGTGVPHEGV